MERRTGIGERSVAVLGLGALLFSPPLLSIFGGAGSVLSIPALFVYLFAAWAAIIVLIAVTAEGRAGPGEELGPRGRGQAEDPPAQAR